MDLTYILYTMVKKVFTAPALPQARRDAPFPVRGPQATSTPQAYLLHPPTQAHQDALVPGGYVEDVEEPRTK